MCNLHGQAVYNIGMNIFGLYDRLRDAAYARYERLFPAPIETRLIEVLGGTVITVGSRRHNDRQMKIIISRGKLLRSRRFRNTVIDGMGVLANDVQWAIAVRGPEYQRDVVAAYERDERLKAAGWRVAYINYLDIENNPRQVYEKLLPFVTA